MRLRKTIAILICEKLFIDFLRKFESCPFKHPHIFYRFDNEGAIVSVIIIKDM